LFTRVFGKQQMADFGYYKQDQTRNPKACCAFLGFQAFIGCFTNGTESATSFDRKRFLNAK